MANAVEATSGLDREFAISNESGLPDDLIRNDPQMRVLMRELSQWSENVRRQSRNPMFDRQAFTPPAHVYDEMRAARTAVESDDIVSGVAEITEAFAFQGMKLESTDADGADVLNQWAGDVNLDAVFRRWWREDYSLSQTVFAMQWGMKKYKVRGRALPSDSQADEHDQERLDQITDQMVGNPTLPDKPKAPKGRKRRKEYELYVPTNIAILDMTKIVPVGFSPLGPEKLAWCATKEEIGYWDQVQSGHIVDLEMSKFYVGKYTPGRDEKKRLGDMGVPVNRLLLLNPELVFRHTLTKSDYEAYPSLRMKSLFPILDLKRQLIAADRASLIGAANYILLVKKGTDDRPGTPEEVDNLKENYNFLAKLPVIISDHRLNIEIIAPKVDLTLQGEKYDTLDTRILMRTLGTLSLGARGKTTDTSDTESHAVARGLENRRHMMKRTFERQVIRAIVEHPRNAKANGEQKIEEEPNLVFLPRHMQLGFDAALLQALMSLRTQREISRETILEQFGLDQATEAMRMEHEEEVFDEVFKTQIPFAAPGAGGPGGAPTGNTGDPTANGKQGGRPLGGGKPSGNTTKPKPKGPGGNTSTKASDDDE